MSTLNTTASIHFPRREASGSFAQVALVAAAAGLTAMVWLSAFGAGTAPRGYVATMMAQAPARVELPRVEIIASRSQVANADATEVAGCAVDRAHKPG